MDNVKRVYRLYREDGLSLPLKRPRPAKLRQPKQLAHAINQIWSTVFVADTLFDGRKLRMLTVVDLFTRECLDIGVGQSLKGGDVARVLTSITETRGLPRTSKSNNRREFISQVMDKGLTSAASNSTSADRASQLITPTWKASTDDCLRST